MIEGYQTANLSDLSKKFVSLDDFIEIARGTIKVDEALIVTLLSCEGCANSRVVQTVNSENKNCIDFLKIYCSKANHKWDAQYLYLLNTPSYLVVKSGVVILESRAILTDTIYPSTGEATVERLIGAGITASTLNSHLEAAETKSEGIWAPLFSRWCSVYFHAITESLVQHHAFSRVGLIPYLNYAVPTLIGGSLNTVASQVATSTLNTVKSEIIKVPRLVFTSLMYSHSVMGDEFLGFVNNRKTRILAEGSNVAEGAERVYVSRLGTLARPMVNEAELLARLEELNFKVFVGEGLSFDQQIKAFLNAKIVVGAHGAGLLNSAFAKPDATVIELRPLNREGESPMWGASYLKLSCLMGFRYVAHVSENEPNCENWTSNVDEIVSLVKKLL